MPPQGWPAVRIVEVNSKSGINILRDQCTESEQLVSIQSAEHVIWLDSQVKISLGQRATSQRKGIPLGYDYTRSNQYYDLNDIHRPVQHIFDELRQQHGWSKGDYHTDQTLITQWYAGFGWDDYGIHDWSPYEHVTYAVICEDISQGKHVMLFLIVSAKFRSIHDKT